MNYILFELNLFKSGSVGIIICLNNLLLAMSAPTGNCIPDYNEFFILKYTNKVSLFSCYHTRRLSSFVTHKLTGYGPRSREPAESIKLECVFF